MGIGTSTLFVNNVFTVSGNLISNGQLRITNAIDATALGTGAVIVNGGTSIASNLVVGGNLTVSNAVSDLIGNMRSIPVNNQGSAYAISAADNGKVISITTGNVTINGGVFASPYGQSVVIFNNSAAAQTVIQGTGATMYLAGSALTGNRTLGQRGLATVLCVSSNTYVISGAGLN